MLTLPDVVHTARRQAPFGPSPTGDQDILDTFRSVGCGVTGEISAASNNMIIKQQKNRKQ